MILLIALLKMIGYCLWIVALLVFWGEHIIDHLFTLYLNASRAKHRSLITITQIILTISIIAAVCSIFVLMVNVLPKTD